MMSGGGHLVSHTITMIRSRASKSYWVIMVTMLLVHHTMAGVSVMTKRQAELEEDPLFHVTSFLDDLEANLLETLDYLIENQEAQDRVLLEDVQVCIALKYIFIRHKTSINLNIQKC